MCQCVHAESPDDVDADDDDLQKSKDDPSLDLVDTILQVNGVEDVPPRAFAYIPSLCRHVGPSNSRPAKEPVLDITSIPLSSTAESGLSCMNSFGTFLDS